MILLAPGLSTNQWGGGWGNPTATNFVSSGVRSSQSDVLVDGVTVVTQEQNSGISDVKFRPTVEMIQEVKVETNFLSAEFGSTAAQWSTW